MSAASQKVRLVLAEKGLTWDNEEINLRGQQHSLVYLALNPNGVVPTLLRHGHAFVESAAISEYLEDEFTEIPLRPADPIRRHCMRVWMLQCEDVYHPAIGFLSYAVLVRPALGVIDPVTLEKRLTAMPNDHARSLRRDALTLGLKAPAFGESVRTKVALLDKIEVALQTNDHLTGQALSLADLIILPYVARLEHMGWSPELLRHRPRARSWLERMMSRKSYQEGIVGWMTPEIAKNWRSWGEEAWPAAKQALNS